MVHRKDKYQKKVFEYRLKFKSCASDLFEFCEFAEYKSLLNFFCSWDKFKLLGNGFKSQIFAGYAASPIRKGLILYPSITSVYSVRKMLHSA